MAEDLIAICQGLIRDSTWQLSPEMNVGLREDSDPSPTLNSP